MNRRTLVVGSVTSLHEQRFKQALLNATGVQIVTVIQLVERLAGGFLRAPTRDELEIAARHALEEQRPNLRCLSPLVDLPGMTRAVCNSLTTAWASGIDLSAKKEEPRCADLYLLEEAITSQLPASARIPPDLLKLALARIASAPSIVGSLLVQGIYELVPCWQPFFAALADHVQLVWETFDDLDCWTENTQIQRAKRERTRPIRNAVSCANPTHEVVEALRWARELIVKGRAEPQDIAIVAASLDGFDDHLRVMCDDSLLPVCFTGGRSALSDYAGQQAAAIAEVLLHGLSQDRVLRAIRLLRRDQQQLKNLVDGWDRWLEPDAPLLSVEHWKREIERINKDKGVELDPTLLAFVEDLAGGLNAAEPIGQRWLTGRARGIWKRALAGGCPAALATNLNRIRVSDETDPAVSILWGAAAEICTVQRRFVRLIGLNSRGWPRILHDDPLLPENILGKRLDTRPVSLLDRVHFDVLAAQASEVVFSRSRRDKEGRLLGTSPLFPADVDLNTLRQSRIPQHAFSTADRLLVNPREFAQSELACSVKLCVDNRKRGEITAHDGLVRSQHPVIMEALSREQSATSLRLLLRDPLGFVWKYALGWYQPLDSEAEEPLFFDDFTKGTFIHELLERAVADLEEGSGFTSASPQQITAAITRACLDTALRWESEVPVPPSAIWEQMKQQARDIAFKALTYPHDLRSNMRSFVEVPFGKQDRPVRSSRLPWVPAGSVMLPGTNIRIKGRIDRLDLSEEGDFARVIDYKTVGKIPDEDPYLNGGKELQRAIYTCVVRALLPKVRDVEAAIFYPSTGLLLPALNAQEMVQEVVKFVSAAVQILERGCALPGIGAEEDYNEMRFALPSNALSSYLPAKTLSRDDRLKALLPLWGRDAQN